MSGLNGESGNNEPSPDGQGGATPGARPAQGLAAFAASCGHPGPIDLRVEAPGDEGVGAVTASFPPPFLIAGRGPAADLVLDDPAVGSRHLYFQAIGGRVFCLDVKGDGLHLDDHRVPWCWLGADAPLRVGRFLIFGAGGGERPIRPPAFPNPLSSRPPAHEALPPLTLEFPGRGAESPDWAMRSALAFCGRSVGCRVRIDDPDLSRFQVALIRTPDGPWLVNLRGRAGVFHNGQKVVAVPLEEGDEIRVGRHRLTAHRQPPTAGPRSPGHDLVPARNAAFPPRAALPATTPLLPASWIEPVRPALPPDAPEWLAPMLAQWSDQMEQVQRSLVEQFGGAMLGMARLFGHMHADHLGDVRDELERIDALSKELRLLRDLANDGATPPIAEALRPEVGDTPKAPILRPRDEPQPASSGGPPRAGVARVQGPEPEGHDPEDLHTDLARRIAALRGEQQGRWQKLMTILIGRS